MNNQLKLTLKWSGLAFVVAATVSLITFLVNKSGYSLNNYIGVVCLIAVIILSSYELRDKVLNGFASAKQLFRSNLLIVLVFAIFYSLWTLLFIEVIDSEMMNEYFTEALKVAKERGADVVNIQEELALSKKMYSPRYILFTNFLFFILFGGLASLSIAAILKKNSPETEFVNEKASEE